MVEFHRDLSTVLVFGLCKQLHNIGRRCGLAEREDSEISGGLGRAFLLQVQEPELEPGRGN